MTKGNVAPYGLIPVTLCQPNRCKVDVLQELGDGHKVDQAIALLPAERSISEPLRKQKVGDEMRRIGLDDREYQYGK
jgi:hypothetical protein